MKPRTAIAILVSIILFSLLYFLTHRAMLTPAPSHQRTMQLTSSAFQHNQTIPSLYTCDGKNINPMLAWNDIPKETKSIALIMDDPDAPRGDWVHWLVWNISPSIPSIAENSTPAGTTQGATDFGRAGYGGPCPPSGVHRYQFKLYALDTLLTLPSSARKKDLEAAIAGHILEQTLLVGLYQR